MPVQLLGFSDASLDSAIDGFLLKSPSPSSTDVANFLKLYSGDSRNSAGQALIARGVSAAAVSNALTWLDASNRWSGFGGTAWSVASVASGAASAYHGYKRNQSIGWGIWWFLMGTIFPIVTPVIGYAQGWGQKKGA